MRYLISLAFAFLCMTGAAALGQAPTPTPAPTPTGTALPSFVAIGGGLEDDNADIFNTMLVRSDTNKIVIVPYASGDSEAAAKSAIARLKKYRPDARYVILPDPAKDDASRDQAIEYIPHADLVYFTGGDQSRLISRFGTAEKPNGVLNALREGQRRFDTRVAGTSAGAAMMSDPMFVGGGSESALAGLTADDGETDAKDPAPQARGLRMGPGLGLTPGVIIDTHFFERGRVGRLVAAVEANPDQFGLGIAEDRAVRIAGGQYTAIGDAAALVVDGTEMTTDGLSRRGLRISMLSNADTARREEPTAEHAKPRMTYFPAGATVALDDAARMAMMTHFTGIETRMKTREKYDAGAWGYQRVPQMLRLLARSPEEAYRAQSERFEIVITADERTCFLWDGQNASTLRVFDARLDVVERKKAPGE